MRLEPIERPRGITLRIAYAFSRWTVGKVITPMKVLYARVPAIARVSYSMARTMEKKLSLPTGLRLLVEAQTSALNGCGFCLDMKHAMAVQHKLGLEKLQALAADGIDSPLFDERERAALEFVTAITRERKVGADLYARVSTHFSEAEIVELAFVNAVENFYNLMAKPFGIESDGLCALALQRTR